MKTSDRIQVLTNARGRIVAIGPTVVRATVTGSEHVSEVEARIMPKDGRLLREVVLRHP